MDPLIEAIFQDVNNGVYRCGFATTQAAYERAYDALFARLDELEARLAGRRFLMGEEITEVDVRLFTTLVRFDAVYHGHFKCNRVKLTELPNLWRYARDLFSHNGFGETVDFDQIKRHYYLTHDMINPTGIVPEGPGPGGLGDAALAAFAGQAGDPPDDRAPRRPRAGRRARRTARLMSTSLTWCTIASVATRARISPHSTVGTDGPSRRRVGDWRRRRPSPSVAGSVGGR